jgi:WD repeat-containing protein 61
MNNLTIKKAAEFKGHNSAIYALADDNIGPYIYSGGGDHYVVKWNIKDGTNEAIAKTPNAIYAIFHNHLSNELLIGDAKGGFHVIDLVTNTEKKYIINHVGIIFNIGFSPDKTEIITVSEDGSYSLWDLNYKLKISQKISNKRIRNYCFLADKQEIIFCDSNGEFITIDSITHKIKSRKQANKETFGTNFLKLSPSGKSMISGSRDAYLKVWDTETLELKLSIPAHNYSIYDLQFNTEGNMFATCSMDKTIKIWDNKLNLLRRIDFKTDRGHQFSINKLIWTSKTDQLISAGDDKKIILWDIT